MFSYFFFWPNWFLAERVMAQWPPLNMPLAEHEEPEWYGRISELQWRFLPPQSALAPICPADPWSPMPWYRELQKFRRLATNAFSNVFLASNVNEWPMSLSWPSRSTPRSDTFEEKRIGQPCMFIRWYWPSAIVCAFPSMYQLRFVSVQLQSVALHPSVDQLRTLCELLHSGDGFGGRHA